MRLKAYDPEPPTIELALLFRFDVAKVILVAVAPLVVKSNVPLLLMT